MCTVPARIRKAILSDPDARAHFVWRHVVSVPRFRCGVDQAFAKHRPELYRKAKPAANDEDIEEKEATTEMRLSPRLYGHITSSTDRYEDGSEEYLPGVSDSSSEEDEEPYVRDYHRMDSTIGDGKRLSQIGASRGYM